MGSSHWGRWYDRHPVFSRCQYGARWCGADAGTESQDAHGSQYRYGTTEHLISPHWINMACPGQCSCSCFCTVNARGVSRGFSGDQHGRRRGRWSGCGDWSLMAKFFYVKRLRAVLSFMEREEWVKAAVRGIPPREAKDNLKSTQLLSVHRCQSAKGRLKVRWMD